MALEGGEAGTYTRGSGRLHGGEARVALEQAFAWTTSSEIGLTVQVTPRGRWADLYVESVSTREIVVRSRDGSDVAFDYVVMGLCIGHEELPVVRPRTREATVPSKAYWDQRYDGMADLRPYNALERFRRMDPPETGVAAAAAVRADASRALREAIGQHHLAVEAPQESPAGAGMEPAGAMTGEEILDPAAGGESGRQAGQPGDPAPAAGDGMPGPPFPPPRP